ncbi:MAG: hypothetical protein DCC71_15890 [Proteobacteria bacterium]|nr:MAG: hypothetical protein DCC71_15890 [Pseudomonadota bacterium]
MSEPDPRSDPSAARLAEAGWTLDVGDADFEREVLERSDRVPVVVDFWAPWCGPCRTLGPLLERLAHEHAGAFVLAKVNVDEAQGLAQGFAVRSIPAVKAIHRRQRVAEFEGAQPESVVRRFVSSLLPTDADRHAAAGDAAWSEGDRASARRHYQAALGADSRHALATLGLARVLAEDGEVDAALERLERIGPGTPASAEADRIAAELRTRREGDGDEAALRARLAAAPGDLDARLAMGRMLAAQGRHEEALEALLEIVQREPHHADDAARLAMLDLFAILGGDHALTRRFRPALARALFR